MVILVFTWDYFSGKTNNKIFQKIHKLYFGAILSFFCPTLGKNEFSWKKGLCRFLNIWIIHHWAKKWEKTNVCSWEKCRTDGRPGGKWWFCGTLRRNKVLLCQSMLTAYFVVVVFFSRVSIQPTHRRTCRWFNSLLCFQFKRRKWVLDHGKIEWYCDIKSFTYGYFSVLKEKSENVNQGIFDDTIVAFT